MPHSIVATAESGYQTASDPYTFAVIAGSPTDSVIVVSVSIFGSGSVSSVTFDGNALTKFDHVAIGTRRVEIWYRFGISGTADVEVNLSGAVDSAAFAVVASGIRQTAFSSANAGKGSATNGGSPADATTTGDDAEFTGGFFPGMVVAAIVANEGTGWTVGSGQTEHGIVAGGSGNRAALSTKTATTTSVNMYWTDVDAGVTWAVLSMPLADADYARSGAAAVTIGAVTASASAAFSPGTRTGNAAATIKAVVASGTATHVRPTYTGIVAATIAPVTASGTAAHVRPTYTGNVAVTVKAAVAAGTAAHTAPIYTGAGAATIAPVTAAGTAAFATSVFLASGAVTTAPVTASGTATFTASTLRTGVIAVTIGAVRASGVIFTDTFDADTSANYTAVIGSGSIAGGALSTSSADFLTVHNTAGTSGTGAVTAPGKVSTASGSFVVIGSYIDANNYLFGEVTINGATSTFKLWQRDSGVNTQIGSTYTFTGALDTYYDVGVTWDGAQAIGTLNGVQYASGSYSGTGNQVGLGASPNGGTASFGSFDFATPSFATFDEEAGGFCFFACCGEEEDDCTIVSDDFSTDTDANYTDVDGTGTVSGGERSTSSSTFLTVHNTAGTTGHGKVTVRGKVSVSGGSFRVIGAWVDSDNHLFAVVSINGSTSEVTIWERVGGSDSQVGTAHRFTGAINTYYTVGLCWDGTAVTASFNDGTEKCIANETYSGVGNQAGYGANISSGTATFDDFHFTKHFIDDPDCPTCVGDGDCGPACNNCSDDHGPSRLQVTLSGFTEVVCPEADCDNIAGTYVVARNPPEVDIGCSWRYVTSAPYACGAAVIIAVNIFIISGRRYLYVVADPAGSGEITWRLDIGSSSDPSPDCFAFDAEVPLIENLSVRCQSTGAAAHVIAL